MNTDEERLQIRVYGDASLPTLIYLPGVHGDWTLVPKFRNAVNGHVQFVEFTYPRTLNWSLDDYAEAIEKSLAEHGIENGWLVGESFGSQLCWPIVSRKKFHVEGIILAGGFVRHPMRWLARLTELFGRVLPMAALRVALMGYRLFAKIRYRNNPEMEKSVEEFIARRTELDRQAIRHRLKLIYENDPREIAHAVDAPVFYVTGFVDPVVAWFPARRWLRKNCPAFRGFKMFWTADHHVLGTAAEASAEQILSWISQSTRRI